MLISRVPAYELQVFYGYSIRVYLYFLLYLYVKEGKVGNIKHDVWLWFSSGHSFPRSICHSLLTTFVWSARGVQSSLLDRKWSWHFFFYLSLRTHSAPPETCMTAVKNNETQARFEKKNRNTLVVYSSILGCGPPHHGWSDFYKMLSLPSFSQLPFPPSSDSIIKLVPINIEVF